MPGRTIHQPIGAGVGVATGLHLSRARPAYERFPYLAGAAAGGTLGGVCADIVEPALSPNHRGIAHSWVTGIALAGAKLDSWRMACYEAADRCAALALAAPEGSFMRLVYECAAFLW